MRIEKYLVQNNPTIDSEENRRVLTTKLHDVNMRIYKTNRSYRFVIETIIDYMKYTLRLKFDNYPLGRGISGANVGIPFNIVVIRKKVDNKLITRLKELLGKNYIVMINPKIVDKDRELVIRKSNCGSLLLKEPIAVERYKSICVAYYDIKSKSHKKYFNMPIAATIQHEIDHNNGILITDRKIN